MYIKKNRQIEKNRQIKKSRCIEKDSWRGKKISFIGHILKIDLEIKLA